MTASSTPAWQLFYSEQGWKREEKFLLAILQAEPVLADGALYSPSDVLILASLRLQDPGLNRLARLAARWKPPAVEQDAHAYPTRVRILTTISPDWLPVFPYSLKSVRGMPVTIRIGDVAMR